MLGSLHEKCAVVGAVGPDAAVQTAAALQKLSHRGAGSTGIVYADQYGCATTFYAPGEASAVYTNGAIASLIGHSAVAAIGHNRYATSGSADRHFQPVAGQCSYLAHNGNLSDTSQLQAYLSEHSIDHADWNDSEMIAHAIDVLLQDGMGIEAALRRIHPLLIGAFSCTLLCRDAGGMPLVAAFRDGHGVRPLAMGRSGDTYLFVSETCAFPDGTAEVRDLAPGELVMVRNKDVASYQLGPAPTPKFDVFELIYFSHPDSLFYGVPIKDIRHAFGRQLAKEYSQATPDTLVLGAPNSAVPYAQGYAAALGLECSTAAITKNVNAGRSFMQPTQAAREALRNRKYAFRADLIRGRNIVFIDDSIVRMTTAGFMARRLKDCGAHSVTVLVGSPPIRYPNFYGIDTPDQSELAAARLGIADMKTAIGCDRLGFLSLDGLLQAIQKLTGQPRDHFELSSFTGEYPIPIGPRPIRQVRHHAYSA